MGAAALDATHAIDGSEKDNLNGARTNNAGK